MQRPTNSTGAAAVSSLVVMALTTANIWGAWLVSGIMFASIISFDLTTTSCGRILIISILKMRRLKQREVRELAQVTQLGSSRGKL